MAEIILTFGERLLLNRRREGTSQDYCSTVFGISRNTYGRLERDMEESRYGITPPELDELTDVEDCYINRRRTVWTQEQCATAMGITRFWFNQMETGKVPCHDLIRFWERDE